MTAVLTVIEARLAHLLIGTIVATAALPVLALLTGI